MSGDRDDDVPPWNDRPEGADELIRAAREEPPMTPEEEDRAVARAQQALAARRPAERRGQVPATMLRRRPALVAGGVLAAMAAAAALAVWLRSGEGSADRPMAVEEPRLDAGAPRAREAEPPLPDAGKLHRPPSRR